MKIRANSELILNHNDCYNLIRLLEIASANIDYKKDSFIHSELLVIDTITYIKSYHSDKYFEYIKSAFYYQPSAASQPHTASLAFRQLAGQPPLQ